MTPHPFRRELEDHWTALLSGQRDTSTTRAFLTRRLADYGPEEVVHSGLLLLNDDVLDIEGGRSPSSARLERWRTEAAAFDRDPAAWNRAWALEYARAALPHLSAGASASLLSGLAGELTDDDLERLSSRTTPRRSSPR